MFAAIKGHIARRQYLKQQRAYQRCALYFIDDVCVALPLALTVTWWPDDAMTAIVVEMADPTALGHAVQSALDQSRNFPTYPASPKRTIETAAFVQGMERFRLHQNIAAQRFNRDLRLVLVEQFRGRLMVCPQQSVRGKFAFKPSDAECAKIPATTNAIQVGTLIRNLVF